MLDVLHAILTIVGYAIGVLWLLGAATFFTLALLEIRHEWRSWREFDRAPVIPIDTRRRSRHV
jgi:hypothetical protein